jgi:hypothetical protein
LEKPTIVQIERDSGEWLKNGAIISDAQNASSAETSAYAAGHNLPRVQKHCVRGSPTRQITARKKLQHQIGIIDLNRT